MRNVGSTLNIIHGTQLNVSRKGDRMKTWFISGVSRGFGALIAKEALNAEHKVAATARNPESVIAALGDHPQLLTLALDVNE
jgi:NAD(P)-dependent dehydrogenase (short-subunit alcohol dehydrogenase family)